MKQVTLYTTPTCNICRSVKNYLESKNIQFVEKSVEDERTTTELVGLTGRSSVPVLEVDGEYAIGYDEARINQILGLS